MAHTEKRAEKSTRRVLIIVAVVIVAAAAGYLIWSGLISPGESAASGANTGSEPYVYEYGARARYALMGKRLAISSSTGLQLLDEKGYPAERQIYSAKNPALQASESACVFYDVGGTALRFYTNGEIINLDTDGSIISASLSSSGHLTVCHEEMGHKGALTVYDSAGAAAFKWYSGEGYLLDAAVSPGGDMLAILCLEESGSKVHLFELRDDTEKGTIFFPNELAFKLSFTGSGSFCVVSEEALHFCDTAGRENESFSFEELNLMDFVITEEICVVSLSKYISGSTVTLTGFSPDGRALGSAELDYAPLAITSSKQKLLVLGTGFVTVFAKDMNRTALEEVPTGYNDAVFLPDGDVLLLSGYHGGKISI